jgi:hypothetical protein
LTSIEIPFSMKINQNITMTAVQTEVSTSTIDEHDGMYLYNQPSI